MTDEDIAAECQNELGTTKMIDEPMADGSVKWSCALGRLVTRRSINRTEAVRGEIDRQRNVILAAVAKARRQLPLDVEFGNEVIPELLKDWDKWGDRTSPSKVRALVARMRERIDHLEKMLAFVMVDQEGERAAELLAMAKECGRLEGVREGYDQGYNEATGVT